VIGTRLGEVHALTADVLLALEGIPVLALSQGPSQCSLSLVVETQYGDLALARIHNLILKSS
jgi:aspartokinase